MTAVVVIAAALTTAAVLRARADHHGHWTKLVAAGDAIDNCWAPTAKSDWARMVSQGVEFGVDVLLLSPPTGRVTVIDAELINAAGGIRLVKAVFAPNAQFGTGFFGADYHLPSYLADRVKALPAILAPTPKPPGATAAFNGASWQLAIVVSAPATATDASATGVRLTYRSGSGEYIYNTVDGVRLVRSTCSTVPEDFGAERQWVRDYWSTLVEHATGTGSYVNFMSDADAERVRNAYGDKYPRLQQIKTTPTTCSTSTPISRRPHNSREHGRTVG